MVKKLKEREKTASEAGAGAEVAPREEGAAAQAKAKAADAAEAAPVQTVKEDDNSNLVQTVKEDADKVATDKAAEEKAKKQAAKEQAKAAKEQEKAAKKLTGAVSTALKEIKNAAKGTVATEYFDAMLRALTEKGVTDEAGVVAKVTGAKVGEETAWDVLVDNLGATLAVDDDITTQLKTLTAAAEQKAKEICTFENTRNIMKMKDFFEKQGEKVVIKNPGVELWNDYTATGEACEELKQRSAGSIGLRLPVTQVRAKGRQAQTWRDVTVEDVRKDQKLRGVRVRVSSNGEAESALSCGG